MTREEMRKKYGGSTTAAPGSGVMTREELKKKYSTKDPNEVVSVYDPSNAAKMPAKMTRAEYEAAVAERQETAKAALTLPKDKLAGAAARSEIYATMFMEELARKEARRGLQEVVTEKIKEEVGYTPVGFIGNLPMPKATTVSETERALVEAKARGESDAILLPKERRAEGYSVPEYRVERKLPLATPRTETASAGAPLAATDLESASAIAASAEQRKAEAIAAYEQQMREYDTLAARYRAESDRDRFAFGEELTLPTVEQFASDVKKNLDRGRVFGEIASGRKAAEQEKNRAVQAAEDSAYYARGNELYFSLAPADRAIIDAYILREFAYDVGAEATGAVTLGHTVELYDREGRKTGETEEYVNPTIRSAQYKELEAVKKALMEHGYSEADIERMLQTKMAEMYARHAQNAVEDREAFAKEHKAFASVISVPESVLGSAGSSRALFEDLEYGRTHTGEYRRPTDLNDPNRLERTLPNVTRSAVSEDMGAVGSYLYNTAMSLADSAFSAVLPGPMGELFLGMGAAADAYTSAKMRGSTDEEATATGLCAGMFEALFEHFSIGQLRALATTPIDSLSALLKNLGKNGIVNFSEEAATSVATFISDWAINGGVSEFELSVRAYMEQGLTEAEAREKAWGDAAAQVGLEGLAGLLMGVGGVASVGVVNYGANAIQGIRDRAHVKNEIKRIAEEIQSTAAALAERGVDNTEKFTSPEVIEIVNDFKKRLHDPDADMITQGEINALQAAVTKEIIEKISSDSDTRTAEDIAAALAERGVDNTEIADAIARMDRGEEPTQEDLDLVRSTEQSRALFSEYFGEDIDLDADNALETVADRVSIYGDTQTDTIRASLSEDGRIAYDVAMRNVGESTREAVASAIQLQYQRGFDGERYSNAATYVSDAAQRAAFEAGVNAKNSLGTLTVKEGTKISAKFAAQLQRMAKDLNMHIVYGGKAQSRNGATERGYNTKYGEIRIYDDVKVAGANGTTLYGERAAAMIIAGHETTHRLQQLDAKSYNELRDYAVRMSGGDRTVERYMRRYDLSRTEAMDEIAADFSMNNLFFDERTIRDITKKHSKLAMAMRRALLWLREKFGGNTDIDRAIQLWNDAYNASVRNAKNGEAVKTDAAEEVAEDGVKHSIASMRHDIEDGKMFRDLEKYCGMSHEETVALRKELNALIEFMVPYRDIVDMNETAGKEDRRFSPYKPNSDPLYKISLDYSTLCSKRLLTQYVIEHLQVREKRPLSAEEQMAVRNMLIEYREQNKALQVACAMCYVEAARLKAPKQINRWLADPTPFLTKYFAKENKEFAASVKAKQDAFKTSHGYDTKTAIKDMRPADKKAFNKMSDDMRRGYKPSAEEIALIEKTKELPAETYLTSANLANLSETDPVIYRAYTSFIRSATRSKSLEEDIAYYYGDSESVTDSFIEAVNAENGMRASSWSDWRIQHLLDWITAVIDLSVRGSAMHAYTKFADEVRVLGKTGIMFNLSGVLQGDTGLKEDGSLDFSDTESINYNEALALREEFPETAGLQCIGVSDESIRKLLASDVIDYVIPYHKSGMSAILRRMAGIFGWQDYEGQQNAKVDKNAAKGSSVDEKTWHKEPVFSEFFAGYDTGMSGVEAMRASADNYIKMCKERGLVPKFPDFIGEDGYWKLLIDRKMVNQKTGELIRQKAVKPVFDFSEGGAIRSVIKAYVDNYDPSVEENALKYIESRWDEIPAVIKHGKGGKTGKAAKTVANSTVAAMPKGVQKTKKSIAGSEDLQSAGQADYSDTRRTAREMADSLSEMESQMRADGLVFKPSMDRVRELAVGFAEDFGVSGKSEFIKRIAAATEDMRDAFSGKNKTRGYQSAMQNFLDAAKMIADGDEAADIAETLSLAVCEANLEANKKVKQSDVLADAMYYGRQVGEVRKHYAEIIRAIRASDRKALEDTRLAEKMYYGERIAKLRRRYEDRITNLNERYRRKEAERREARDIHYYREHAEKKAKDLHDWLLKPDKKGHSIPEAVRKPIGELLASLNFEKGKTNRYGETTQHDARWQDRMKALAKALEKASEHAGETVVDGVNPYTPQGILDMIKEVADNYAEVRNVYDMNLEQLQNLDEVLSVIHHHVSTANKIMFEGREMRLADIGDAVLADVSARTQEKKIKHKYDLMDSFSYADHIGGTFGDIIYGLRDRFNVFVNATAAVEEFTKGRFNNKDVRAWRNEIHTFNIGGASVDMTATQLMSLYCLSRREQGLKHLLGEGIVVDLGAFEKAKVDKKTKSRAELHEETAFKLNEELLNNMLSELSPAQKKAAEDIQEYMSTVLSGMGNEVSMRLYGYRMYTEDNYFPIRVDSGALNSDANEENPDSLHAIANSGMTKRVEKNANNAVDISDIFSVFTDHASDMLNYYAYAEAIEDALKVFNYRDIDGVRVHQQISQMYTKAASEYFKNLIRSLNGQKTFSRTETGSTLKKLQGNTKAALVGANLRVVAQQPSAIFRAAAVMNPKYLTHIAKKFSLEEVKKYCPIARWKSWGFFDTDIGKSLDGILFGETGFLDKAREAQMVLAGKADEFTWGLLWNACEAEIKDKRKDLSVGSEEFKVAVGERLSEIVDATQVVDSPFHKTQMGRGDTLEKTLASFQSEPLKSYNLLYRSWQKEKGKRGKSLARALVAAEVSTVMAGVFAAFVDGLREDDDEVGYWEAVANNALDNIIENVNPLSFVPVGGDASKAVAQIGAAVFDNVLGTDISKKVPRVFDPTRYELAIVTETIDLIETLISNNADWYDYIYNGLKVVDYGTGVGFSNAFRDIVGSIYNLANGLSPKGDYKKSLALGDPVAVQKNYDAFFDAKCDELAQKRMGVPFDKLSSSQKKEIESSAKSSIKTTTRNLFEEPYIKAWLKGDTQEINVIRQTLAATELYKKKDIDEMFESFKKSYYKEEFQKSKDKDKVIREAIARGVFKSKAQAEGYFVK